jgi:hypothetical protein
MQLIFAGDLKMAEANGNRTHPGPSRPHTGFEDQGHHQAPVTSAGIYIGIKFYTTHGYIIINQLYSVNKLALFSIKYRRSQAGMIVYGQR